MSRYTVAYIVRNDTEGWAPHDTHTGCRCGEVMGLDEAAAEVVRLNQADRPDLVLARVAQGIGSAPSPDQLTRLHEAARVVLGGGR